MKLKLIIALCSLSTLPQVFAMESQKPDEDTLEDLKGFIQHQKSEIKKKFAVEPIEEVVLDLCGLGCGTVAYGVVYTYRKIKRRTSQQRLNGNSLEIFAGDIPSEIQTLLEMLTGNKIYKELGIDLPAGYLLVGPPGCGKTALVREISRRAHAQLFPASASEFVRKYQGSGNDAVKRLYDQARAWVQKKDGNKAIVFIDEIDAVGARGQNSNYKELDLTIIALLNELDGFKKRKNIITLAATNNPNAVDEALKRSGRLGNVINIPLPSDRLKHKIIKKHLKTIKNYIVPELISSQALLDPLIQQTTDFNCADIAEWVNLAKLCAIKEKTNNNHPIINIQHFQQALQSLKVKKQMSSQSFLNSQAGHQVSAPARANASNVNLSQSINNQIYLHCNLALLICLLI